jgi:hypothetical protein
MNAIGAAESIKKIPKEWVDRSKGRQIIKGVNLANDFSFDVFDGIW